MEMRNQPHEENFPRPCGGIDKKQTKAHIIPQIMADGR